MENASDILKKRIMGIDYGNKYSGTTVICYNSFYKVRFIESSKNTDADSFILTEARHVKPDLILIDAPLTLPGIYFRRNGYSDHFFRTCDRELKAMSPMFLGGLTARAIRLKRELNRYGIEVMETYPRKLVELIELPTDVYKQSVDDLGIFTNHLVEKLGITVNRALLTSWHRMDALLAFLSGLRHLEKKSKRYGKMDEGVVYV